MKSNRILIIVIALLTITSTAFSISNFFLFKQGQKYYYQLHHTRLDPAGLTYYPPESSEASKSGKRRFVFFGDSRAYQWPDPAGIDQFEFVNRGIGAQTSVQMVERFDDHLLPLQPDVVLIQICINDLKTIPLFPQSTSEIIQNCKHNIEWSVQEIVAQGGTVILTTTFPLGKLPLERRLFWSEDVQAGLDEVNKFIDSLAGEKVIVFDAGEVLANEQGIVKVEYRWDFLHLNKRGYEALNQKLVKILAELE